MDELLRRITGLPEPPDLFNGRRLPKNFALPDNILLFHHDFISPKPLFHSRWTVVVPQGEMCYLLDEVPVKMGAGDVLIIMPAQVRYLLPTSRSYSRLFITFELPSEQSYMPENRLLKFGEKSQEHLLRILESFRRGRIMDCSMEIVRFITSLDNAGVPVKPPKFSPFAAKAISYINRNLSDKPGGKVIARALNVSESYLRLVFRREVGMSMSSYISMQCLNIARHFLRNSDKSISEIADVCGYRSIYAFSAFFKKNTGKSPSRFRRELAEKVADLP